MPQADWETHVERDRGMTSLPFLEAPGAPCSGADFTPAMAGQSGRRWPALLAWS